MPSAGAAPETREEDVLLHDLRPPARCAGGPYVSSSLRELCLVLTHVILARARRRGLEHRSVDEFVRVVVALRALRARIRSGIGQGSLEAYWSKQLSKKHNKR